MNFKKNLLSSSVLLSVLALSACGGSGSGSSNATPSDITIDNLSVDENVEAALIGSLSAVDADTTDTFIFSTSDSRFVINGTSLSLAEGVTIDFESEETVTVSITVTDTEGASFSKDITLTITDALDTYEFDSAFVEGSSSVSYTGQIARHALIAELNYFIGDIKTWLDANPSATKDDVLAELNKIYFVGDDLYTSDSTADENAKQEIYDSLSVSFADAEQTLISDISSSYKNISGKIAGNDDTGQDIDWDTEFSGWDGAATAEALVIQWFDMLADNAVDYNSGIDMDYVYVTELGLDLKQLIQKHLLMAVTYSQATGDYLGVDYDGKGLTTQNTSAEDGKAYSTLEHQFDEGFGYFGAPIDYLAYTDEEIAQKGGRDDYQGMHDFDGNAEIDLTSEYVFGAASNAAKRDLGATIATDFTADTMNAFLQGRKIINDAAGAELSDSEMTELLAQRDIAIDGWEKAIAATVVHYINDTIADLETVGTESFDEADMAKHWSEMKGFGLGLQFNPYSNFYETEHAGKFEQLHTLMQDAPIFDESAPADVTDYIVDLEAARDILEEVIGFDSENVANW